MLPARKTHAVGRTPAADDMKNVSTAGKGGLAGCLSV